MSMPRITSNAASALLGAMGAITIYSASSKVGAAIYNNSKRDEDIDALKSKINKIEEEQRKAASEILKSRNCSCRKVGLSKLEDEFFPYPG